MSERVRGGAFRMVLPATWQLFQVDHVALLAEELGLLVGSLEHNPD